ncbi:MAG TPA: lysoplasmalogenase [Blastocatellia bacterium]|nr:lysoplasmalogenase [Blastocatellia bacterium]
MSLSPVNVWRWRALKSPERVLFIVSIICGASYLLAPFLFAEQIRTYWPLNATIKGLAVSPLAVIAFRLLHGRDGMLLGTALIFSSLGDIFLALRNGNYFVFGLLSFLVAHLFFIALWTRHWPQPLRANSAQKLVVAALLLFLVMMLWWILPVPGLSLPVAIYMCVLTTMVVTAALVEFKGSWVVIGAVLFLISDTLIALGTFKNVVGGRLAGFLIWSTYYLAQYLMTFGFLLAHRPKAPQFP